LARGGLERRLDGELWAVVLSVFRIEKKKERIKEVAARGRKRMVGGARVGRAG
jgi:hypothetical protein